MPRKLSGADLLRAALMTILGCGAAFQTGLLRAQIPAAVSGASVTSPAKSTRIAKFTADRLDDKVTPVGAITSLLGHAKIISDGTTTLTTDTATYNRKTNVANAPGHLQIDDPQNTIIGDSGIVYYVKRQATITGNVHITMRPKPELKDAPEGSARREFKSPVYITCEHVVYDWRTRIAVATGSLIMKYEDRTITAEKATYYGREETVVLTGKVHYSRPNNDFGDTEEAVAKLTEGHEQFWSPGPGAATVTIDGDEEDSGSASGAVAIPPPPGTSQPSPPAATPPPTAGGNSTPPTPPTAGGGSTPPPPVKP